MNLHVSTQKGLIFEILFWIFVAIAIGISVFACYQGWSLLLVLGLIALGVLIYGGFIEPRLVRTVFYRLGGEGEKSLRLVFLSDLHAGLRKGKGFYQRIADTVNKLEPSIVVLGGDFVDERTQDIEEVASILDLRPALGVWFILGNHDFFDDPKKLVAAVKAHGVRELTNQTLTFPLEGERSLELVGLDDSWYGSPDLRLVEKPRKHLRIIAMHEPDLLLDLPENCADLVLLGHTHGGQIRLPIRGPVVGLPQSAPQWLDAGEKKWKEMRVIISRGIGESLVRARLGSRPEIVVLDVR